MFNKKTIAFIPARGGSKRLPGKNLKPFLGKPLLHYSIDFAKKTKLFEEIVLSSDDSSILSYGRDNDIIDLKRPLELSGDLASTASAAQHALNEIEKSSGVNYDYFVTLQPTNPLRSYKLCEKAMHFMETDKYDTVMTVSENHKKIGRLENGLYQAENYNPGQRSQDLTASIFENGMFYCTKCELIRKGEIFGENVFPLLTDDVFGMIDIDNQLDFDIAEFLYSKFEQKINHSE